jgi:poly(3-hydroxybutyrate) depolymerase
VCSSDLVWPAKDYWIYEPPAASGRERPMLVVYLHGTSQTAPSAAHGVRWNELADREGVIVVYPQGIDENWGWGVSTQYGRGVGELESVARITREVQAAYGISAARTFIAGASSGAITATMMGALYPELYSGVMSALGCSYSCVDPSGVMAYLAMGERARVMPAFLVHGTLDPIFSPGLAMQADTQWVGTNDLADNGQPDGSVSPVPVIDTSHLPEAPEDPPGGDDCSDREDNSPCPGGALGYRTYPYEIHRYQDGSGRTIVESWIIHGLSHNYPYGDPDGDYTDPAGPDITTAGYRFFDSVSAR